MLPAARRHIKERLETEAGVVMVLGAGDDPEGGGGPKLCAGVELTGAIQYVCCVRRLGVQHHESGTVTGCYEVVVAGDKDERFG